VTEVPPADSIGRHLCEVACSCGLFRTTALGREAGTARAEALHSFEVHRARADQAGQAGHGGTPARLRLVPATATAPEPAAPVATRRGVPLAALVAVAASVLAVGVVVAAVAMLGGGREYAGTPTLVGGPDRTGPADLATTDAPREDATYTTERGTRYDQLRERSDDVELWSDDRIDQVSRQICALVRAGHTVAEMADELAADGIAADEQAVRALSAFAQRFDC
jgi:hypothetical protein